MHITIVRHGETDYNKCKRIQGFTDVPLNETGRDQAKAVSRVLKQRGVQFDAAFSSDLSRARETAELIVDGALGIALNKGLRERNMGALEGKLPQEAEKLCQAENRGYLDFGETEEQLNERSSRALCDIIDSARGAGYERILVVAHGGVLRMLIWYLVDTGVLQLAPTVQNLGMSLNNCSLTTIEDDVLTIYNEVVTESLIGDLHAL